ncbi:MAG: SPL family radical SAM protein [Candidatus Hecatellaceae archaeon]
MGQERLSRFNAVRQAYCTCPPKYNVNPYLGRCSHNCLYCYAVKFPSFQGPLKPRVKLAETIGRMAAKTRPKLPVMLSDTTDPYQPPEARYEITRSCLEALIGQGFPILIVTKSDLVVRDLDLLVEGRVLVSMTVTSLSETFTRLMEPGAPPPYRRLKALRKLASEGVPVTARIDPIIPGLNDDPEDLEHLVRKLRDCGVRHVTASTLKPVRGFYQRLARVNPRLAERLQEVYRDSKNIVGYNYLPAEVRLKIVKLVRSLVLAEGMSFASCREGFPQLNTSTCDGTAYLNLQRQLLNPP